jgi:hypothetical protein
MCVQKWPIMADGVCRWICSWNHCGTNKMRFLYTGLISGCVKQRLDCSRLKHDHAFYYWKKIHLFKYFSHSNCDASLIVIVLVKRKFTEILPSQKTFSMNVIYSVLWSCISTKFQILLQELQPSWFSSTTMLSLNGI